MSRRIPPEAWENWPELRALRQMILGGIDEVERRVARAKLIEQNRRCEGLTEEDEQ